MQQSLTYAVSAALLLMCSGCSLLEYHDCELTYTVRKSAHIADVRVDAQDIHLSKETVDGMKDRKEDPKVQYNALTDKKVGVVPKVLSQVLCAPDSTSDLPEFEKLPASGSFRCSEVLFDSSLLAAFAAWDYSVTKKGKQCIYVIEATAKSAEETPWDWLSLISQCKVVAHNADEVDEKTGKLRWKIDRGIRKEKIMFTLEQSEAQPKRGGW